MQTTKIHGTAVNYVKAKYPGIEILDATKPLEVQVTKGDCKASSRKDPRHCALAEACNRQEEVEEAIVGANTAVLVYRFLRRNKPRYRAVRYALYGRTREVIQDFDHTGAFPEGTYRFSARPATQTFAGERARREQGGSNDRSGNRTGERSMRGRRSAGVRTFQLAA